MLSTETETQQFRKHKKVKNAMRKDYKKLKNCKINSIVYGR